MDLALPGTLPVLNKGAVERAIRFGLAVGGTIAPRSGSPPSSLTVPVMLPRMAYCVDNAAMIAGLAHHHLREGRTDDLSLPVIATAAAT